MEKRMLAALALPVAAALLWAMPPVRAESAPSQEELYYLAAEVVLTKLMILCRAPAFSNMFLKYR